MERSDAYERARGRIEARRGFFVHLAIYAAVMTMLAIINMIASPDTLWFQWPLMGWGIGVFFHGLGVFVFSGRLAITDEMVERELGKEHQLR